MCRITTYNILAWLVSPVICLSTIGGGLASELVSLPERCPATAFEATFLQLLSRDEMRTDYQWRDLLEHLHRQGIRTLIIQWTSVDEVEFYPDPTARRPAATV